MDSLPYLEVCITLINHAPLKSQCVFVCLMVKVTGDAGISDFYQASCIHLTIISF